MHVLMHSGFRAVRKAFPGIRIEELTGTLQDIITKEGSLIMPAFTYCFRRNGAEEERFDRHESSSKVGAVSEVFRQMPGVVRTSSPTHSFSLWGAVAEEIPAWNAPQSPLGEGSVPDWLTRKENSHVLLLGADFTALSYAHYLETEAPVPWADHSPWKHLGVEGTGLSKEGNQPLVEVPGCSRAFRDFERYLLRKKLVTPMTQQGLRSLLIAVSLLYREGLSYFRKYPEKLLCRPGSCPACDERWDFYLNKLSHRIREKQP